MEQKKNHTDSPLLVTGASGFIGSFLVERALEEGREVWAAVRRTSSRRYLSDPRIRFIELDLGNDERLKQQLMQHLEEHAPFGAVIHAAGATRAKDEEEFCRINAEGTLRLALTLLETQTLQPNGRFVFISSLSVCGDIHELDREPLRPTDTPLPNTAYGRSKLKAERMLAEVPGLNYVVLRPTGVYGPREKDYFLMAKSIKQHVDFAVGFKPQILTFIYVRDLVEAAFLALNRGKRGAIYHLSDGREARCPHRRPALGAPHRQLRGRQNRQSRQEDFHAQPRQVSHHEATKLAVRHHRRTQRTELPSPMALDTRSEGSRGMVQKRTLVVKGGLPLQTPRPPF